VNKKNFLYGSVGLLVGLVFGFFAANWISIGSGARANRPNSAQTTPPAKGNPSAADESNPELTEDEVREAIAAADKKPEDADLQRNLGLALYRYAGYTQDVKYLPEVVRFLKRASDADPKDRDLLVGLGNVHFDMGQHSDPTQFPAARSYYLRALELKSDDADVRTDLGLTYFFAKPSDPARAIVEYRKSLEIDPKHEATLQNLAAALIATREYAEAEKRIQELQTINSSNPAVPNLRAQLSQSRNAQE
jgi:tetratricopeptide (TPR) repeat protein